MWGDHARESVAAQADRLIAARSTASFDLTCAKQNGTPAPAKKTWLTSAGSMDRTAARSVEEGAPVGASIFSVNVNVPWNPPFRRATSTVTGPTFSSKMSRIGSPGPTCCFITRAQAVPTEGCPATSSCVRGVKMRTRHVFAGSLLREDEGRFAEIEFAGNLLHAFGPNAGRVR